MIRIAAVAFFLLFQLACSNGSSFVLNPTTPTGGSCDASAITELTFLNDLDQPLASPLLIENPSACRTFKAALKNDCGNVVGTTTPDNWSFDSGLGFMASNNGPQATLCLNRGAGNFLIAANQSALSGQISVQVTWPPTSISNLTRWYKADSYLPLADQATVGLNPTSLWSDFSGLASPFNAYALAGREPKYDTTSFSKPTIRICGSGGSSACTGISTNQHMRLASNFNDFANSDLTVIYVAARANANANYLLVNQSIGNNTGTFMGWINNTSFRFGLNGPSATTAVTTTVPSYSGSPGLEIWAGRLNTGSDPTAPGLRLYLNNVEVAADSSVAVQQSGATTIPYIGSQRSDQNNAQMYIAEVLIYKRALTVSEMCRLHQYLSAKYQIVLSGSCTP